MRNELIKTLELASLEKDPAQRAKVLTIVVAEDGPTGVEVAGLLAEMRKHMLANGYPKGKVGYEGRQSTPSPGSFWLNPPP
jgi:NADH:ubiquinone reductase (H+-translocating)